MIPSDLEQRRKVIKYMLDELENADSLTKWEEEFTESISVQFETKKNLSERQCEILEKIYEKVTS